MTGDVKEVKKEKKSSEIGRRSFLRKLGAGAIGIGIFSLPSVSALDIKSSTGLEVFSGNKKYLDVESGGPVSVNNTGLNVSGGLDVGVRKVLH